jgi:hypothetical protein
MALLTGKDTQHLPRRVTAADCHNETSTRSDGCPGVRRDNRRSLLCDSIGIGKYFNLHCQLLAGRSNSCSSLVFVLVQISRSRFTDTITTRYSPPN